MAGRSLLAVLALLCQIAAGAVVPQHLAAPAQLAGLEAAHAICFAGRDDAGRDPAPAQHDSDCALCPLCLTLAAPGGLLSPAPALPVRIAVAAPPAWVQPPAQAPPVAPPIAAYPRGPPVLA